MTERKEGDDRKKSKSLGYSNHGFALVAFPEGWRLDTEGAEVDVAFAAMGGVVNWLTVPPFPRVCLLLRQLGEDWRLFGWRQGTTLEG